MNKYTLLPIIFLIVIFTSTTSIAQDHPIQLGKGGITDIAYIADGTKIVNAIAAGCADGTIHLWFVEAGTPIKTITGHTRGVTSLANEDFVRLIDVNTGEKTHILGRLQGTVNDVCFSMDGKTIAISNGLSDIYLWDVRTGEQIKKISPTIRSRFFTVFNRDGTKLITGDFHGVLRMIDVETGSTGPPFGALNWCIADLTLTNDGNTLISNSTNGAISLWDISKL